MKKLLIFPLLCVVLCANLSEAKKIKNSFHIVKDSKSVKDSKFDKEKTLQIDGIEIVVADPDKTLISFAGYEKEANASKESFIVSNASDTTIVGCEIRLDYLDMKHRMLHSRTLKVPCNLPPGESRKLDIKSWDTQHTYYYYLGNEPKKVATPYQVSFTLLSYWVEPRKE